MLSIGLMSGTSMDGIDAALLATDGSAEMIQDLGDTSLPYDPAFKILLKAAEYCVRKHRGNMPQAHAHYWQDLHDYLKIELKISAAEIPAQITSLIAYLHGPIPTQPLITLDEIIQHSTRLHGIVVKNLLAKTGLPTQQVDVVGYHGQTLFHQPAQKTSIIIGDGQALANFLGITVVNDFRSRDIEAGGQGAPLAPLYHQALAIRDQKIPVIVANCGGIANITVVNSANELDLIAFDTGPGNGLIDRLVRQRTQGKACMDVDGQYGSRGQINADILTALYARCIIKDQQNYFAMQPPKSLDIGDLTLIPELDALSLEDACATLEAFTADMIVKSLDFVAVDLPRHWILAGGGWHNPVICRELRQRLQRRLNTVPLIQTADQAGWNNSQAMEAQIFAYLAVRSLQGKPLSMPGTTRAPTPLSGGKVYFPA